MKFKILIENTTKDSLISEHGLSIYIELGDIRILLDSGQSDAFMDNARSMGIDLKEVDFAVLSHGHYDHSGGFDKFLEKYKDIELYAMKDVDLDLYSGSGDKIHYIGVSEELHNKHRDRFKLVDGFKRLRDNVYVVPHNTEGLNEIGKRCKLYKKSGEGFIPDDFSHELSLVIDTRNGLVVFNSCSHGGVINIIEEVKERFPDKRVYAFVGGLHMKGMSDGKEICIYSDEELKELINYLLDNNVNKLYTGHCTGAVAYEKLKLIMQDKIEYIYTGREIII